jgi:hypothetical protein
MQVAAMDKLHYFTIKCQEQFAHQDRIDELNTAAWNASPQTTEMYKWIHMYFCSDDKKTVPFDSEEAPPSMQVRVLKCDEDDSDSDDDEDDGSVVEEDDVVQDNMKDILACRTERSYSLSERFRKVFEKRSRLLMHPFATAAWLCSPVPQVQETWTRMDESDKGIVNDLIVKLLVPKCRTQAEADELGDDMKNSFWDEWEQFSSRTGCYEERYKWASHDITNNRSHFWHKKHSIHCTQVLGRLACIVTSKICGIGNAERQWRDVKQLKQGQRSHLSSRAVRMQATLYGDHCSKEAAIRKERIIDANGHSAKGMCIWEDDDLDACGLDAYGIDIRKKIEESKPSEKRLFKCWQEDWEQENIKTRDPVILQKFLLKYRNICWLDLDNDVVLTHHPTMMGWTSHKPSGVAAFGLLEGYDMDVADDDQLDEYELWCLNEDFYDCVKDYYKQHPDPKVEIIDEDDYFKKPAASAPTSKSDSDDGSDTVLPSPKRKGKLKRDDSDLSSSDSDDEDSDPSDNNDGPDGDNTAAASGEDDESEKSDPDATDRMPMSGPCFRCHKIFYNSTRLFVEDGHLFHSEQCFEKYKRDIVHPTPGNADLTGIADYQATPPPDKPRKPTALNFDESPPKAAASPTRVAAAKARFQAKSTHNAKRLLDNKLKAAAESTRNARRPRGQPDMEELLAEKPKAAARRSNRK